METAYLDFGANGMQIAFLSTRAAKPSFRFRVERMLPYFAERGHRCETFFLPSGIWQRLSLYRKLGRYDVVFLQKRLVSRPEADDAAAQRSAAGLRS